MLKRYYAIVLLNIMLMGSFLYADYSVSIILDKTAKKELVEAFIEIIQKDSIEHFKQQSRLYFKMLDDNNLFERYIRLSMHITYDNRFQDGDPLAEKIIARALELKETTHRGLDETIAFAIKLFTCVQDLDQVDGCYYLCRTLVGMCGQSMDQALEHMQQYAQTLNPVCLFGTQAHTNGYEKIYCTYLVPAIKMITKDCSQLSEMIIQKAIKLCKLGVTQKDAVRFATVLAHAGADDEEYIKYQYHLYYAAVYCLKKDANESLKLVLRCAMPMMTEKEFIALLSKLDYKEPWWTIAAPAAPTLLNLFPELLAEDLISEDKDEEQ